MNSQQHKHILFILPSLVAGGSERVMSSVATGLNNTVFKVTFLVIGFKKDTAYNIDSVNAIYLNKHRASRSLPAIIKQLRKLKPDVVISSLIYLNMIMAIVSFLFPKIKFVARESNILSALKDKKQAIIKAMNKSEKAYFPSRWLIKFCYHKFNKIICQCNEMQTDLIENFGIKKDNTVVINNPISSYTDVKTRVYKTTPIKLITIGRLDYQKGYDRLLQIVSQLNVDFQYTIIGTGPLKQDVLELINTYKLNDKITHIPYTNHVYDFLKEADVFLQGSHYEGFPNAVLESCYVGTPAITFNIPGGTNDIITEGINGHIVNSQQDYIDSIQRLANNYTFNNEKVRTHVVQKFNKEYIMSQYENLFNSL